jgi:hypothetical protein
MLNIGADTKINNTMKILLPRCFSARAMASRDMV